MSFTIYHNPKCSKSRQTLALLEEHNIKPEIVLYLQDSPSQETLSKLNQQLDCEPNEMFRFKEELARELNLSAKDDRPHDEWLSILANNPRLMERPIVTDGTRAVFGRPPENVLALLK